MVPEAVPLLGTAFELYVGLPLGAASAKIPIEARTASPIALHAHIAIATPQPRPICTARDSAPNQDVKRFHCWLILAMLCMLPALRRMLPSCEVRRIPRMEVTCRLRSG